MAAVIPFIALAASLAGTGTSIAASQKQSRELKRQAKEQERQGQIEADLQRRKGRELAATQKTRLAKGLQITGTASDLLGQTFQDAELNATRAAFGFTSAAAGARAGARAASGRAIEQGITGAGRAISATTTILDR